ncbi:hypothetical protein BH160DRAFT_0090 [Burkholderia sp. H160]|nr:hypothetical protein BH160DRAFT_0090 [Burkholderia sp. H160]
MTATHDRRHIDECIVGIVVRARYPLGRKQALGSWFNLSRHRFVHTALDVGA